MENSSFDKILDQLEKVEITSVHGRITEIVGMLIKADIPQVKMGDICIIKRKKEPLIAEVVGFTKDEVLQKRRKHKNTMDKENLYFQDTVIGFRELRNNISEVFENVIYNYEIVRSINKKKRHSDSAVILAAKLLEGILYAYTFKPVVQRDTQTGQQKITLNEIDVIGSGETKEDAAASLLEAVKISTVEYFNNIDLNMRIDQQKIKLPYYLKIKESNTKDELMHLLSL